MKGEEHMTQEEYIDLFHRANVNLVAFKQVYLCDDELRKMVEMAIEEEREQCAKWADLVAREIDNTNNTATYIASGIRARGKE